MPSRSCRSCDLWRDAGREAGPIRPNAPSCITTARRDTIIFRTQHYGQNAETRVYRSKDPADFGIDDDGKLVATLPVAAPEIVESHGRLYIAALMPNLKGIQVARLGWMEKP